MAFDSMRSVYKQLVRRATRSAFAETERAIEELEEQVKEIGRRVVSPTGAVWRGTLGDGQAITDDGRRNDELTEKYRGELAYWVSFVRQPELFPQIEDGYERAFARWQRDRVLELGEFLGLDGEAALDAWCAEQAAVELGPGPFPMLAAARWRTAVAVDPIADGYVAEGLLPTNAHVDEVVYLAAPGEAVPLPSGRADLVVIENCLDHVSDPKRVMSEIVRLLRPGGLVWLLVDLMDYSDAMHPHSFGEPKLRALIESSGLTSVRDEVRDDHKSHPEAYGEYRALLRKALATGH